MQSIPEADVIITNPTHYAIAIAYNPEKGLAPIVTAKGADYIAKKIKDKAKEYDIQIVENKKLKIQQSKTRFYNEACFYFGRSE